MAEEENSDEDKQQEEMNDSERSEEAEEESTEDLEELESALQEGDEEESGPQKPVVSDDGEFYGTGRRKESVARVWIEAGDGTVTVNDKSAEQYFQNRAKWVHAFKNPIECVDFENDINVWATLEGGGLTGQAEALQLGIARALVSMDERARTWLKQEGYLTRDDRHLERKKINQPGARAKQQVSKR